MDKTGTQNTAIMILCSFKHLQAYLSRHFQPVMSSSSFTSRNCPVNSKLNHFWTKNRSSLTLLTPWNSRLYPSNTAINAVPYRSFPRMPGTQVSFSGILNINSVPVDPILSIINHLLSLCCLLWEGLFTSCPSMGSWSVLSCLWVPECSEFWREWQRPSPPYLMYMGTSNVTHKTVKHTFKKV